MRVTSIIAALAFLIAAPQVGHAQQVAGYWNCTYGVRDTSPQRRPTVLLQFQLNLQPNGTGYGQGVENEMFPIQLQGNWQVQGREFMFQGQVATTMGMQSFFFASNFTGMNSMANTFNAPDGNIIVSACNR